MLIKLFICSYKHKAQIQKSVYLANEFLTMNSLAIREPQKIVLTHVAETAEIKPED